MSEQSPSSPQAQDVLIYDWNEASGPAPELVDHSLGAPRGARLTPGGVREVSERLASVGIRRLHLSTAARLPHLPRSILRALLDVPVAASEPELNAIADAAESAGVAVELWFDLAEDLASSNQGSAWRELAVTITRARDLGLSVGLHLPTATCLPERRLREWARRGRDGGAQRLAIGDRAAPADPRSARLGIETVRAEASSTPVDWRGGNRTGLGVASALAAAASGAARVHGVLLGMGGAGEEVPLDQVAINLDLAGAYPHDLSGLIDVCEAVAGVMDWPIARNYPLSGLDAFRTATGVHAAAIVKALAKGDSSLADRVYSGVPAGRFGKAQVIDVGPMSGMSNVRHWLLAHQIPAEEGLARAIFDRAKASSRTLTSDELEALIRAHRERESD